MVQFCDTLKAWRQRRRYSQLELAVEAGVSSRHLSFLETGRSNPSREMVGRLGDALNLPMTARNQLLTQAGFVARYSQRSWETEEMGPIRAAISHTLTQHAPYPALAIDRHWTILQLNRPAEQLFAQIGAAVGISLIDIVLNPQVQSLIENWPEVAHHSAQRLRTESIARGGDAKLDAAIDALSKFPQSRSLPAMPVTPTIYRTGDMRLSLFSTIAQFGTPEDLALDDVKLELFFPSDEATDTILKAMDPVN